MPLTIILLSTLAAGIGSVWVANFLIVSTSAGDQNDSQAQQRLLSLATGALLSTAFTHLLPEAFESKASPQGLFATLLVGLVFFFLLSKVELSHDEQSHSYPHLHQRSGWSLLIGDSVHGFGDGVLIASTLAVDIRLGIMAALSVFAHEVPHHMGDLVVLRQGRHPRSALLKVFTAGAMTTLGGVAGYVLVDQLQNWHPFFVTVAGSSFIYVALSNLIPQLRQRRTSKETTTQMVWLVLGVIVVALVGGIVHE